MKTLLLGLCLVTGAACSKEARAPETQAADNTGRNVRDRDESAITPTDQSENEADLRITQEIRRALTADDSLSFDAKNIKVVTQDGTVTLRGPVESEDEKRLIEEKVRALAGSASIDNQLEVAPD